MVEQASRGKFVEKQLVRYWNVCFCEDNNDDNNRSNDQLYRVSDRVVCRDLVVLVFDRIVFFKQLVVPFSDQAVVCKGKIVAQAPGR